MMDVIRRNTDYALRAAVELAHNYGQRPVATKQIAARRQIPYQLACKLLQRLNRAGIVKSEMGPAGGFKLGRKPSEVTVAEVIEAVQGPICISRCLVKKSFCILSHDCSIHPEVGRLQKKVNAFLRGLTLKQLAKTHKRRKNER